jgi:HSP20 family protein
MAREIARRQGAGSLAASRWDPFQMMREMMGLDPFRAAERAGGLWRGEEFTPSFDVKETSEGYEIHADLPGVKEEDVDVSLSGNRLTISGKRDHAEKQEDETYYALERSWGSFTRSFTLPEGVDEPSCGAEFENGVLTVWLPRSEEEQPKRIKLLGKSNGKQAKEDKKKQDRGGHKEKHA